MRQFSQLTSDKTVLLKAALEGLDPIRVNDENHGLAKTQINLPLGQETWDISP